MGMKYLSDAIILLFCYFFTCIFLWIPDLNDFRSFLFLTFLLLFLFSPSVFFSLCFFIPLSFFCFFFSFFLFFSFSFFCFFFSFCFSVFCFFFLLPFLLPFSLFPFFFLLVAFIFSPLFCFFSFKFRLIFPSPFFFLFPFLVVFFLHFPCPLQIVWTRVLLMAAR